MTKQERLIVSAYIGMYDGCRWKQEKHAWTKE